MPKVLISTSSFAEYSSAPIDMLLSAGMDVKINPYGRKLKEDEAIGLLKDIDYLIAGTEKLDRRVFENSKKLKVISRCGVGLDNIDLKAAEEFGIKIYNTPCGPTRSVAEFTLALILNILRKINNSDKDIRENIWKKRMGSLLYKKIIGIIGLGKIGKLLTDYLVPFNPEIIVNDIFPDMDYCLKKGISCVSIEELLSASDIVTLHISITGNTRPLIRERELKMMKKNAVLINTSRGEAVDEESLYAAIKRGWISGSAIDVYQREPYCGRLTELDNVILTPHVASYTLEERVQMEIESAQNLLSAIDKIDSSHLGL